MNKTATKYRQHAARRSAGVYGAAFAGFRRNTPEELRLFALCASERNELAIQMFGHPYDTLRRKDRSKVVAALRKLRKAGYADDPKPPRPLV